MARERALQNLTEAEAKFKDPDPYVRAHGYTVAANAYDQLASSDHVTGDITTHAAYRYAATHLHGIAARIRFENSIPTLFPQREATLLNLAAWCLDCGRPWQPTTDRPSCPQCPRLLFGPTPESREDSLFFPAPQPVDPATWVDNTED